MEFFNWKTGLLAVLVCLLTCLLWWLIRKQKKRVWIPILRVIDLDRKALPQLKWVYPPWLSFLAFLISAIALSFFSFMPFEVIKKDEKLDLKRTHILFDLSPSVKFHTDIEQYRLQARRLLESLGREQKLTLSSTLSTEITVYGDDDATASFFNNFRFHGAGSKIGSAVQNLLEKENQIERLIIVSDRDQASWDDFNWQFIAKQIEVSRIDLGSTQRVRSNVFIDDVHFKEKGIGNIGQQVWSVVLRRIQTGASLDGTLDVEWDGRKLASKSWSFAPAESSLEMDVVFDLNENLNPSSEILLWTIRSQLPSDKDLDVDNQYKTLRSQADSEAVIISPPRGEMMLDDSVFHLKSSLEVSGIKVNRMDQWTEKSDLEAPHLLVSEVFPQIPLERFCPVSLLKQASGKMRQVWLVPSVELNDYGTICHCFSMMLNTAQIGLPRPRYCEDLQTREQWIGVMQSLGAKQVGGEISDALGALAMSFVNEQKSLRVLGFTVPLQPLPTRGMSFGQLPLIVRSLLQLFPIHRNQLTGRDWPRITDSTRSDDKNANLTSNIPFAESSLQSISSHMLPSTVSLIDKNLVRSQGPSSLEKDSDRWIRLCFGLIIASVLLEIGGNILRFFWKSRWKVGGSLIIVSALSLFDTSSVEAQVRLNTMGFTNLGKLGTIKREVSGRTSIELEEGIQSTVSFQKSLLNEPWIWVASPYNLLGLSSRDWADLIIWIKRGGFLVIEKAGEGPAFKEKLLANIPLGQWKPIPPDHELMRSFHLLASLPQCGSNIWEGFHFDDRVAALLIPGDFLGFLLEGRPSCYGNFSHEQALRVFINLQMVALATDYKKDQIHLPEILKRLR